MSVPTFLRHALGLLWPSIVIAALVSVSACAPAPTTTTSSQARLPGRADVGQRLYEAQCLECHAIDHHRIGPLHQGVMGRLAGTAPGYDYSTGLKKSGLRWTPETLDRWLANPDAYVQNQQMDYQVPDAQQRADLIAYLATLK